MENKETGKTTSAISDLIKINNDRSEGYKTAADETKDNDLKAMFSKFSSQSKGFSDELRGYVTNKTTEEVAKKDETTNSGKLFRVWMDIKAAITGKDRHAILASCEFGEDAALKTYDTVLEKPDGISTPALTKIREQRSQLKQGHDTVKAMRDSSK